MSPANAIQKNVNAFSLKVAEVDLALIPAARKSSSWKFAATAASFIVSRTSVYGFVSLPSIDPDLCVQPVPAEVVFLLTKKFGLNGVGKNGPSVEPFPVYVPEWKKSGLLAKR